MFAAPRPDPSVSDAHWPRPLVPQRADPWVWRHTDGFYYFTATTPAYDRIEVRRAASLDALGTAEPVVVWRKPASGPMSHHVWAPELHAIDGRWLIYFAAGRADDIWAIRMYALECADPDPLTGRWNERGQIRTEWESFSLDATTFAHDGQRYLVWAQHDPAFGGNTSLFIARMATPTTIIRPQVRIADPVFDWETGGFKVNEGPAVLVRGGRIFITYSASATDARYCMGLLTASADADLLDPMSWKKTSTPVLTTCATAGVYGPGHNSFTTLPDGRDVLVYHARDYRDIVGDPLDNPDRHTRASLVRYDTDGMPVFHHDA